MVSKINAPIRDEAYLLRSTQYGDHHRILSCLTREQGRVDLIALGATKSRKRFSGVLDFLNLLKLEYQPNAREGLGRLVHCDLKENYPPILKNYDRTVKGLSWLRMLSRALPAGGQVPGLMNILQVCLRALQEQDPDWVDLVFYKKVLSALGYHMQLNQCVRCGNPEAEVYFFSTAWGGLSCSPCHEHGQGRSLKRRFSEGHWRLEGEQSPWDAPAANLAWSLLEEGYQNYLGISLAATSGQEVMEKK